MAVLVAVRRQARSSSRCRRSRTRPRPAPGTSSRPGATTSTGARPLQLDQVVPGAGAEWAVAGERFDRGAAAPSAPSRTARGRGRTLPASSVAIRMSGGRRRPRPPRRASSSRASEPASDAAFAARRRSRDAREHEPAVDHRRGAQRTGRRDLAAERLGGLVVLGIEHEAVVVGRPRGSTRRAPPSHGLTSRSKSTSSREVARDQPLGLARVQCRRRSWRPRAPPTTARCSPQPASSRTASAAIRRLIPAGRVGGLSADRTADRGGRPRRGDAQALDAAGADVYRMKAPEEREVRHALEGDGIDRVVVVSRDDAVVLRTPLMVRNVDADVPMLVTIFDPTMAGAGRRDLEHCEVTSMADIVAPVAGRSVPGDDLTAVREDADPPVGLRETDDGVEEAPIEVPRQRRAAALARRRLRAVRQERRAAAVGRARARRDPAAGDDRVHGRARPGRRSTPPTAPRRRSSPSTPTTRSPTGRRA